MYRQKRARTSGNNWDLDALMDVLSCSVGILLFVIIFAVIEARGSSIAIYAPLMREPPAASSRIIVLCQDGNIRLLEIDKALETLLEGSDKLAYSEVPAFVEHANEGKVADRFFRYRLLYRDEGLGSNDRKRVVSLRVEEKPGAEGEDVTALRSGSSFFERELANLDKNRHWLAFAVDVDSLDVFHQARKIAMDKGFSSGWDPLEMRFPHEEVVLGGTKNPPVEGKPRSGLGIIQ